MPILVKFPGEQVNFLVKFADIANRGTQESGETPSTPLALPE